MSQRCFVDFFLRHVAVGFFFTFRRDIFVKYILSLTLISIMCQHHFFVFQSIHLLLLTGVDGYEALIMCQMHDSSDSP